MKTMEHHLPFFLNWYCMYNVVVIVVWLVVVEINLIQIQFN